MDILDKGTKNDFMKVHGGDESDKMNENFQRIYY